MFDYRLTIEEEQDIIGIFEYGLHKFGIAQAEKYCNMLFKCFDIIVENSLLFFKAYRINSNFHFCVCGVNTIYYQINDNTIEIIKIVGRQNF